MKGWKTVMFNGLIVLGSVIAYLDIADFTVLDNFLPKGTGALIGIGIGVVNIVLRAITTTPIGKKA